MNAIVNEKQNYEELERDPSLELQRKQNAEVLFLRHTDAVDIQRCCRLTPCSVPRAPKFYGIDSTIERQDIKLMLPTDDVIELLRTRTRKTRPCNVPTTATFLASKRWVDTFTIVYTKGTLTLYIEETRTQQTANTSNHVRRL